jgi:hypothetical protein
MYLVSLIVKITRASRLIDLKQNMQIQVPQFLKGILDI